MPISWVFNIHVKYIYMWQSRGPTDFVVRGICSYFSYMRTQSSRIWYVESNPTPSFRAWSDRKKQILFVQIEDAPCAQMVLLVSFTYLVSCYSSVSQVLDSQTPSEPRLLLCLTPRRVHLARPWTHLSEPAQTGSRAFALASSVKDTASKCRCGDATIIIHEPDPKQKKISVPCIFGVSISLQVFTWCHFFFFFLQCRSCLPLNTIYFQVRFARS